MHTLKLFIILLFCLVRGYGQPAIEWEHNLGGTFTEAGYAIEQTTDGRFIAFGYTSSNDEDVTSTGSGTSDFWAVKLNTDGVLEWENTIGGSYADVALGGSITPDGGCVLIGYTHSTDGDVTGGMGSTDYWIVKLRHDGSLEWEQSYGGSNGEVGRDIENTADGGYIVTGHARSNNGDVIGHMGIIESPDYWVLKLNAEGEILWQRTYGGYDLDDAYAITETTDGGFIVAGHSTSTDGDVTFQPFLHGNGDVWVAKISAEGDLEWENSYGADRDDRAHDIQQTLDGGYILTGNTQTAHGAEMYNGGAIDYWVVKIAADGTAEWQKVLGGSDWDEAHAVRQTHDGGYIVAGISYSEDGYISNPRGGADAWLVKLTESGNFEWDLSLGGSAHDGAYAVNTTEDNGYIITGYTQSNDGDISGEYMDRQDMWTIKLEGETIVSPPDPPIAPVDTISGSLANYLFVPNVFTPNTDGANDHYQLIVQNQKDIELTIINRWGQVVFDASGISPQWDGTFNGKTCTDGTYFAKYRVIFKDDEVNQGQTTIQMVSKN